MSHCCGILGHRMDVCPNPRDKVCRGCDAPNPGPDYQCSPRGKLCGCTRMTAGSQLPHKVQDPLHRDEEAVGTTQGCRRGRGRCHHRSRRQAPTQDPGPPVEAALPISEPHTRASEAAATPVSQLHTWRDPNEERQGHRFSDLCRCGQRETRPHRGGWRENTH
ncbi:hypothetical protein MTO96_043748 [Rhipicephalus appendiculatus]